MHQHRIALTAAALAAVALWVVPPAADGPPGVRALRVIPGAVVSSSRPTGAPPTIASCLSSSRGASVCYQPAQLRVAYDLPALYHARIEGQRQTIVIVDAYGSPTIGPDLQAFDAAFGLPAPPSFRVIRPAGAVPAYSPRAKDRLGWAEETSLDVEWAHAIAPLASILLVETPTDEVEGTTGFPDIVSAENYVIAHRLGTVISQSFGATEPTFSSPSQVLSLRSAYAAAQKAGVTVVSGSGDLGATDFEYNAKAIYSYRVTSWPASDPLVTAVGGTHVTLNASGHQTAAPVAWNDHFPQPPSVPAASGGGRSTIFARPAYQQSIAAIAGSARAVPDVSMSASCTALVDVYVGAPGVAPGWLPMCGTSEATPLFAAIVALADQVAGHGLGLINPALYALSRAKSPGIVDVTSGDNSVTWAVSRTKTMSVSGFSAVPGYDLVTGVGTVDAARFVPALAREVAVLAHHR